MAVIRVKQTSSREWSDKEKGEQQGSRTYHVICSDKITDDPDVAGAACPPVGSIWSPAKPGLAVISRQVAEGDITGNGGVIYLVTLEYSTKTIEIDQQEEDPRERPMKIRLGFASSEETIYKSQGIPTAENANDPPGVVNIASTWVHGTAICNSVGKPFPDGVTESFVDATIQIQLCVDTNDFPKVWKLLKQYAGTVNSDNFTIPYRGKMYPVDAGTAWCTEPTSEPMVERIASTGEEVQYEDVSLTLRIREDGWLIRILDQGFEEASGTVDDPNFNKPRPLRDENGDPVLTPQLLNGKGKKLPGGAKPVFLKFKTKTTRAFRNLLSQLGAK